MKFHIEEEEELHYPYSENKGTDQLRSYCEADLGLCFRIGKNPVFSRRGSYHFSQTVYSKHHLSLDRSDLKFKNLPLMIFFAENFFVKRMIGKLSS